MTNTDDTKPARTHTPEPWTEEYLPYISVTGEDTSVVQASIRTCPF